MAAKRRSQGGVWTIDRPGRPHPFGVQWRELARSGESPNGAPARRKTKTEFFETAEKRDARAAELRKQKRAGALVTASRSEIGEWQAFRAAVGEVPWQDVVAGYRAYLLQNGLKECAVTVDQAIAAELGRAERLFSTTPPQISRDTLRQKRHKLRLFGDQFGSLKLHQVKAEEVEAWIDDFAEVESEATFNNYRKHVRTMFQAYVEDGTLRRNPIDGVRPRDDSTGEVGILAVDAAAHLFAFAMESERFRVCLGRLALEAFAGLRFSSGCRLAIEDLNFTERGILLPKHKIKTKKRHYIDQLPDQVWAWLEITPPACWELTPRQYLELKSALFVEAGVPHPHNCLRHSFCTYDVAAHKNPGRTAFLLCHRDQDLLWARYKGNATELAGKRYQSITPQTAAELARGYVPLAGNALPAA